ncbi:MAG: NUDIX hydrolase [Thermoplasmatota archaeon]
MIHPDLAKWRAACSPEPARAAPLPPRASAVLLPIYVVNDEARMLFTLRSESLSSHAGQVSFPGGRIEGGETPLKAALRETEEEIGLAPNEVEVLGHLFDYVTFRDQLVSCYVALARGAPTLVARSLDEVAEVFTVPIADLLAAKNYESRVFGGHREGREAFGTPNASERQRIDDALVHYFHVEPHPVWGVTGRFVAEFLARAYGWRPPGKTRVIEDFSDFLP